VIAYSGVDGLLLNDYCVARKQEVLASSEFAAATRRLHAPTRLHGSCLPVRILSRVRSDSPMANV